MEATIVKASEMKLWAGRGVRPRYRLANDTFSTACNASGHAREEGYLPAGTIVSPRGVPSDTNPWTGNIQHNRPSGVPCRVEGFDTLEILDPEAEVEPLD